MEYCKVKEQNINSNIINYIKKYYKLSPYLPNNRAIEKFYILRSKVVLKLLSTMDSPQEMCQWMPVLEKDGLLYTASGHIIILPKYEGDMQPIVDHASLPNMQGAVHPLIRMYASHNGLNDKQAIYQLAENFNISHSIISEVDIGKSNWSQSGNILNSVIAEERYDFFGEHGLIYSVLGYHIPEYQGIGQRILLPIIYCIKPGLMQPVAFHMLPFKEPLLHKLPLYNLPLILNTKADILVTPRLEEAKINQQLCIDNKIIFSGWYGGAETMSNIDISSLREKSVFYLFQEGFFVSYVELDDAIAFYAKCYETSVACNFIRTKGLEVSSLSHSELISRAGEAGIKIPEYLNNKTYEIITSATENININITYVIKPFFEEQTILVFASPPGVGKTYLSLSMAHAISQNVHVFQGWPTDRPRKVLMIDGEMGISKLKKREKELQSLYVKDKKLQGNFFLLSKKLNLCNQQDQEIVEEYLDRAKDMGTTDEDVSVLIIDNLGSLCENIEHSNNVKKLFDWLFKLKDERKISIILIHHTLKSIVLSENKKTNISQVMKGSSVIRERADTTLILCKTSEDEDDYRISVFPDKTRLIHRSLVKSFEIELDLVAKKWIRYNNVSKPNNHWKYMDDDVRIKCYRECKVRGDSDKKIAEKYHVSRGTIAAFKKTKNI
jgi:hypothetical protein